MGRLGSSQIVFPANMMTDFLRSLPQDAETGLFRRIQTSDDQYQVILLACHCG